MSVSSPFAEKTSSMLSNLMIPADAVLGSLVAFGVFSSKNTKHVHQHVQVKSVAPSPVLPSPLAPVAKKMSPVISKVNEVVTPPAPVIIFHEPEPEPVLEPKSIVVAQEIQEVVEEVMVEAPTPELVQEVVEEVVQAPAAPEVVAEVAVSHEMTAEQTFEQYRQAMLHTGPRDMEYQARSEMQTK
jgi:hypothetical protein